MLNLSCLLDFQGKGRVCSGERLLLKAEVEDGNLNLGAFRLQMAFKNVKLGRKDRLRN